MLSHVCHQGVFCKCSLQKNRNWMRCCDNRLILKFVFIKTSLATFLSVWNFSFVNKSLAMGWSCTAEQGDHRGGKPVCENQIWRRGRSKYWPADSLPACLPATHTNTSNTLPSVTWSVWWHHHLQRQSSDMRGLDWEVSLHTLSCSDNQNRKAHIVQWNVFDLPPDFLYFCSFFTSSN